jgi:hypothetical protein
MSGKSLYIVDVAVANEGKTQPACAFNGSKARQQWHFFREGAAEVSCAAASGC